MQPLPLRLEAVLETRCLAEYINPKRPKPQTESAKSQGVPEITTKAGGDGLKRRRGPGSYQTNKAMQSQWDAPPRPHLDGTKSRVDQAVAKNEVKAITPAPPAWALPLEGCGNPKCTTQRRTLRISSPAGEVWEPEVYHTVRVQCRCGSRPTLASAPRMSPPPRGVGTRSVPHSAPCTKSPRRG